MKMPTFLLAASLPFAAGLCPLPASSEATNAPVTPGPLTVTSSEVDAFLTKWNPVIEKQGFIGASSLTLETNALAT